GDDPAIDAFVTQEDANSLSLGVNASLWIPAVDRTYNVRVVKVDRTSGFLSEMQSHLRSSQLRYNWRGQQDRSAYVQLAIVDPLAPEEKTQLAGGTPATLSVSKHPWLWTKLKRLLGS